MSHALSLVPGLQEIVDHNDPARRDDAVRRISELFIEGAARFRADHVELFDGILCTLVPQADEAVRGELAARLATIGNAPRGLIGTLALDANIDIAGPLLRHSTLIDEPTLVDVAMTRGQPHLMAISVRTRVTPSVTDVIVSRGDGEVVRRLAGNTGADFSNEGYSGLIKRAEFDDTLAITVGQRDNLPPTVLKDLLSNSVDVVRRRLFDAARPTVKIAINRAMSELSHEPKRKLAPRDFAPAQRAIVTLHNAGQLTEATLLGFAKARQYEESIAALSAMSGVRIPTLEQLLLGERQDPVLILGKSIGLDWATVHALILLRLGSGGFTMAPDIEEARQNYQRLAPATALRVLQFWRMREPG